MTLNFQRNAHMAFIQGSNSYLYVIFSHDKSLSSVNSIFQQNKKQSKLANFLSKLVKDKQFIECVWISLLNVIRCGKKFTRFKFQTLSELKTNVWNAIIGVCVNKRTSEHWTYACVSNVKRRWNSAHVREFHCKITF